MDISGKNVLITGGSGGIGAHLVGDLLSDGANVCVFDINEGSLNELKLIYPAAHCYCCDVSNSSQVESQVAECISTHGPIDVLINNAAYIYSAPLFGFGPNGFAKHSIEMWDKVIRTDLSSAFYMTVHVVEAMIRRRVKGLVINVSSICSAGNSGQGAYSAAKAGLNALTVAWAKELGSMKVRVVSVAPGFINTEMTIGSVQDSILDTWVKKTPLRRLGEPEEISKTIKFIIDNDFVNGVVVEIDGGLRI